MNSVWYRREVELEEKQLEGRVLLHFGAVDYMATIYKYDHKDPGQGLFRPTAETTIEYLKKLKSIPSYRGLHRVEMVIQE